MIRIKEEIRKDKNIKDDVPVRPVCPLRAVLRCYHRPRISRPVRPALSFRAPPVVAVVEREIIGKEEE